MYTYRVKVVRVVDGDTVDVDIDLGFDVWLRNERVRLEGIDAPESRTSDPVEKIFGLAAKQHLQEILSEENDFIALVSKDYDPRGKFGRVLGDLLVNGESVCYAMVADHHATPYYGGSKEKIEAHHQENRKILLESGSIILDHP